MTPEPPQKQGLWPRLGSKFRYSGRTQYQSRMAANLSDRNNPEFERTLSRRKLSSRSMDGKESILHFLFIHLIFYLCGSHCGCLDWYECLYRVLQFHVFPC